MIASAPRSVAGAILWSRIDDDLSVATSGGVFAGYVDRRSTGVFLLFDHHSRHVGVFPDETTARSALGTTPDVSPSRLSLTSSCSRLLRGLAARLTPPT